ncbi:MAG: TonB-dependent receptor [Gemmatimonadales bacterium]|nr:MAG: TonB-dependent receptor [Gemmatimonadales bacterium]
MMLQGRPRSRCAAAPSGGSVFGALALSSLLTLLVLLPAGELVAQGGTLSGRVTSQGEPVQGAQVSVEGTSRGGLTDARGLYTVANLAPGSYTVRVQRLGYATTEASVTLAAGSATVLNFVLDREAVRLEQVAVTVGSRARVMAAEELTVPVDVFTRTDLIEATPQLEMTNILETLSPSIYFSRAQIADITSGVRPFQLRGLSPDHSLVLINGKRRHPTAVVHVFGAASGGSGSSGVDMNAIVPSALGGMEILRDGAAPQYGSDAIAGVINLQLRRDIHKPEFSMALGQYTPRSDAFRRDGTRTEGTGSAGFALGDQGTLVISGMLSHRQRTDRAGPDPRDQVVPGDADLIEKGPDGINRIIEKRNDVPQPNHLIGDGETFNSGVFFNANTALGADQLREGYAFGGFSFRRDNSSGFYRRGIDNRNWPDIHPLGFLPSFRGDNRDFMLVTGMRGSLGLDWTYDLSAQWNRNELDTDIYNTLNVSLGPCLQTACAPGPWPDGVGPVPNKTDVYAGTLKLNQAILAWDVNREVDIGVHTPLNVALGTSFRADNFQILAGEPASWVNGGHLDRAGGTAPPGSQVFTGFRPDQEADEWRTNVGIYSDVEADLTQQFRLAAAARFENYSDFGSTLTGKMAARFQPAEQFVLRGAVSTGFRAPNLSQSWYSHVSTGFRNVDGDQVAYEIGEIPVSSPEAQALGAQPLTEERSFNLSGGLAWSPAEDLTFTVDGYQIDLKDRIILTGTMSGPTVAQILAPFGAPEVKFFTNAVDTRTRGLDISGRYRFNLATGRFLEVLGQYNRNIVEVTDIQVPNVIEELRDQVFGSGSQYALENGRPKDRGTVRTRYVRDALRLNLSGNFYGLQAFRLQEGGNQPAICTDGTPRVRCVGYDGAGTTGSVFLDNGPHLVFDAEASLQLRPGLSVALGAENLTNREPPVRPNGFDFSGNFPYYSTSGLHMNGRYIYTQLRVQF